MSEKDREDLFYFCSLIEHIGRKTKNRRGDVVRAMSDATIRHQLDYADINHSLPFDRVSDELVSECQIGTGSYDTITGCRYTIPTVTSIGRVYADLAHQACGNETPVNALRKVFGSFISDEISDFKNGVYCENPSYILESYKAGSLLQ